MITSNQILMPIHSCKPVTAKKRQHINEVEHQEGANLGRERAMDRFPVEGCCYDEDIPVFRGPAFLAHEE